MTKIYVCQLCGDEVRASVIPEIIAKEKLCVNCYKTKYKAFGDALKQSVHYHSQPSWRVK